MNAETLGWIDVFSHSHGHRCHWGRNGPDAEEQSNQCTSLVCWRQDPKSIPNLKPILVETIQYETHRNTNMYLYLTTSYYVLLPVRWYLTFQTAQPINELLSIRRSSPSCVPRLCLRAPGVAAAEVDNRVLRRWWRSFWWILMLGWQWFQWWMSCKDV